MIPTTIKTSYACDDPELVRLVSTGIIQVGTSWDEDAQAYLLEGEAIDGQGLEPALAEATNDYFLSMKNTPAPIAASNWDALLPGTGMALCMWRTIDAAIRAFHPSMPAPTNVGFLQGDYSRTGGCQGDTTKWIDSNFYDTLPQQDIGMGVYGAFAEGIAGRLCGISSSGSPGMLHYSDGSFSGLARDALLNPVVAHSLPITTFVGLARNGAEKSVRAGGVTNTAVVAATVSPNPSLQFRLFAWRDGNTGDVSNAQLSFGFAGRAIDLTAMDSHLTAFMAAINAELS